MTRIEMRTYYRKCAGILSLMNVWLFLMSACLAIYLSEIEALNPEVVKSASEIVINGLYVVFAMGAFWALFYLICGILGCVGQKEGIFSLQKVISFVSILLMIFSVIISIQIILNKEIDWDAEQRVMSILYCVSSFLGAVFAIIIFIYSTLGMKYYDRGKKLAKDVPDIAADRPKRVLTGWKLICGAIFTLGIAFLGFYFKNMIIHFDKVFVTDNKVFSMMFYLLFGIGILLTVLLVAIAVLSFQKKENNIFLFTKSVSMAGMVYHIIFIILSVISLGQRFVQNEYPNPDYVIFSFFVSVIAIMYLFTAFFSRKKVTV